jgi:opacity protein-like surface antigen
MDRSPRGWLVAVVPGKFIAGKDISYYVTAELPGSQQTIHLGYPQAPRSLIVRAEPRNDASEDAGTADSLAQQADSGRTGPRESRRRAVGSVWLSIAGGSGVVYHGKEAVDSDAKIQGTSVPVQVEEGFSPATLLQLEPELGYQASRRLSVSLMARYQYAPKDTEGSKPAPDEKAVLTSAFALYLQARLFFLTVGNFQAYASGGAGFGRSFLAVVDKDCEATSCRLGHSDTLHGGGAGLLAGAGAVYHLSPNLGVFADVKEIATLPKFMALTEFSLGVAVAMQLGPPRAERLAAVSDGS